MFRGSHSPIWKKISTFLCSIIHKHFCKQHCFQLACWVVTTHKLVAYPMAPNPIWAQHKQSKFNRTSESILRLLAVSDSEEQKHLYLTWDDLHIWPGSLLFKGCGHAPTAAANHCQMFLIGQVSSCLLGVGWSLILQQQWLQCYHGEGPERLRERLTTEAQQPHGGACGTPWWKQAW